MEMTPETIKALLDAFDRSDWREMVVTVGEDRLHVSRDQLTELGAPAAAAPTPAPQAAASPAAPPAAAEESPPDAAPTVAPTEMLPDGHVAIDSPSVGLFWRAPAPGAPPFVEVGQRIAAGDTVAIVEVMKLMNHVASPVDGVVTEILVENGGAVEFGRPIVVVDPEG
jgi:acetyl-CoA carboxylase biotin carboxyl carrier protein